MSMRIGFFVVGTTIAGLILLLAAGCSKPSETGAPPPPVTVGTELDDSVVTTTVKAALMSEPLVKSLDLKVETRKGEVMLSGFVDDKAQMDRAAAVAAGVAGVHSVQNNMNLKGTPATVGNMVDDGVVTTRVKTTLLADEQIKSFDIAVVTRKGEVQLSGFVDNQGQIDRAVKVARDVEGVRGIKNELSVKK